MTHCPTLIHQLRQRGYRITPQREMIVQALASAGGHMTAEKVFESIQDRTSAVNIATVYRTLDTLVTEGLVSRTNLWEGQAVYATHLHGPHIHLVCRQCGSLVSVMPDQVTPLVEKLRAEHGFSAELQHLSISGLCAACQSGSLKTSQGP